MLLCADAESARADLVAGSLRCPSCGRGRLGPWGRGRERAVRLHRGERAVAAPPRGRCRSCGATHMLLPSWMAPRRADGTGVIARASAAAALHGTGSARLGAELGVPPATCGAGCGACAPAGDLRQDATAALGRLTAGRDWPCLAPCGSPLGDALAAVIACARAAIAFRGHAGRISTPSWAASASAPPSLPRPAADRQVPSPASSCPDQGRCACGERRNAFPAPAHRRHERPGDTMSTQPGEMPELHSPHTHLQ